MKQAASLFEVRRQSQKISSTNCIAASIRDATKLSPCLRRFTFSRRSAMKPMDRRFGTGGNEIRGEEQRTLALQHWKSDGRKCERGRDGPKQLRNLLDVLHLLAHLLDQHLHVDGGSRGVE